MKQVIYWVLALLLLAACSTPKKAVEIQSHESPESPGVVEDSLEYEVEIFDQKFETWYAIHNNPSQYRSQEYYENWNRQYVAAWNTHAMNPRKSSFFEPIVGWDPTIDYGFELNHKLFYYFQYVENVLNIQIMPGGPESVAF